MKKEPKIIKPMNPKLQIILALLLAALCLFSDRMFGQVFTGLSLANKGAVIQLGAMIDKTELKASYTFPLLKNTNARILDLRIGQKFDITQNESDNYSIMPYLGYGYLRWNDYSNYDNDATGKAAIVQMNEFKPIYGLQIGKDSHAANVYLFGQYCKTAYYGIGIKIYYSKL